MKCNIDYDKKKEKILFNIFVEGISVFVLLVLIAYVISPNVNLRLKLSDDIVNILPVLSTILITMSGFLLTSLTIIISLIDTNIIKKFLKTDYLWNGLMTYFKRSIGYSSLGSCFCLIFMFFEINNWIKIISIFILILGILSFFRVIIILFLIMNEIRYDKENKENDKEDNEKDIEF